jgi:outer membrane biosynthesis protein TonB
MKEAINKEENRTKAAVGSLIVHSILLAFLIFYTFPLDDVMKEEPVIQLEWGGGGDDAAAGLPDEGQGDKAAPQGQQMEDPAETEPVEDPTPTPTPPKQSTSEPVKTTPTPPVSTTNDPDVAAIKQQKEAERQKQAEADRVRREQQAAAQAEADRKRKEQEDRDKKKGQFGGSFGKPGSTGTGQGNTGKPGNQGIPGGTGDNPFGKSSGSGGGTGGGVGTGTGPSIGGGLGGRAVRQRGAINDNSQKQGKVVIEVCVDSGGNVISADYTQRGSTTSDSELRNKALAAAKGYKFAASGSAKECGTITFNFQLK